MTVRTVKVYPEPGYYVARHGDSKRDPCYFIFFLEPPEDAPMAEYLKWYSGRYIMAQAIDDRWPPQKLRLDEMNDVRCLDEWRRYSQLSDDELGQVNGILSWAAQDVWRKIYSAWREITPNSSFDYVAAMRDVIEEILQEREAT